VSNNSSCCSRVISLNRLRLGQVKGRTSGSISHSKIGCKSFPVYGLDNSSCFFLNRVIHLLYIDDDAVFVFIVFVQLGRGSDDLRPFLFVNWVLLYPFNFVPVWRIPYIIDPDSFPIPILGTVFPVPSFSPAC